MGDLSCDVPCLVYCAPETRYMMGGKRQYTAYLVMVTLIAPYRVKVTYQNGNKVVTEERIDPQVCTHSSNAYLIAYSLASVNAVRDLHRWALHL